MKRFFIFLILAFLTVTIRGQQFDNPVNVPIAYYGSAIASAPTSSFTFGAEFGGTATSGSYTGGGGKLFYSSTQIAYIQPGKIYSLNVTSTGCGNVVANFPNIAGYEIYINGIRSSSFSLGANYQIQVRLEAINDLTQALAGKRGGQCSSFPDDKPIWYIGLGSLRNGKFAGAVGFRASAIAANLLNPSSLVYDTVDSSEVQVSRDTNGYITQISAREVTVVVDPYSAGQTSYNIKVCLSSTPTTPFITYTIKQYPQGSSTGIQIDKLEGNERWSTVLQKTASGWQKYDWRLNSAGFSTNAITTTVSGSTSSIDYGSVDLLNATNKLTIVKTFTTINGRQELASYTAGVGLSPAQTTAYSYYTASTGNGWSGALKSKIEASGEWVAYDYYNTANDSRAGLIARVYRPWLDAPTTPTTATISNSYVESYDYASNYDGSLSSPSSKIVTVNGTTIGKTTWAYNWSYSSANSHTISRTTEQNYASSGVSLSTITLGYRPDDSNTAFRGKTHAIIRPDGTKDSYAYYFGTWNASTNTFSAGSGNDRQIMIFHGQNASGTGTTLVNAWASWSIDPIYLVPNLSTVTETVVDTYGHIVFKGENIYTGSALERIAGTSCTYNSNNLVNNEKDIIRSINASGGDVSVGYTYTFGGLLETKTEIDGVKTKWTYDSYLRNNSIVTAMGGTGSYPETTQSFSYYSSNLKQTGQETAKATTITTYRYDTSGRVISSSIPKPGSGTLETTYDYSTNLQVVETFKGNEVTKQTNLYLDGRTKTLSGSGQVDSRFDYAIESSTGYILKTARHGADKSNGWVEESTDWLGRIVKIRTPQFGWTPASSGAVLRKTYNYNSSTGQLSSVVTIDEASSTKVLPDHIYSYGNLGILAQEGDDIGNNGTLDASSTDRIKIYTNYFYKDTSGYNGWISVSEAQIYRTLNNSTDLAVVSQKLTRLTRFNNGVMQGTSRVLSDVTTLDSSDRYTVDCEWADASARTRTHYRSVQGVSSNAMTYWQDGYLKSEVSASGVTKTLTYDAQGRLSTVTEGTTNSAVTNAYHASTDVIQSVTTTTGPTNATYPSTAINYSYSWNTTDHSYTLTTTDAAGGISYTQNNAMGLTWRKWGTTSQPTEFGYDAYGRCNSTKTWQTNPAANPTTWTGASWPANPPVGQTVSLILDPATGLVQFKKFADNSQLEFSYNARGQIKKRTWARLAVTNYNYFDTAGSLTGELQGITYSDSTQPISYTYSRTGSIATVTDSAGVRTIAYRSDLKPSTETYDNQFYGSKVLTQNYDSLGRNTGYSFNGTSTVSESFGYDPTTGRLNNYTGSLGSTSVAFTPTYAPGTDWVDGITSGLFSRSMPLVGRRDVIASVTTKWNNLAVGTFTADYNDSRGWRHGQTSSSSAWTSALALAGALNATYTYDLYGQLTNNAVQVNGTSSAAKSSTWNYDVSGNRLGETGGVTTTYIPGSLNQYTSITGSPLGESSIGYDADGNMTSDGTWTYGYDCENRIKSMTKAGQVISFKYDHRGRRIQKTVTGTSPSDTKYLWNEWKIVAELSNTGTTVNRAFIWGPDFSDAQGQAGGAGSLLAQIDGSMISYAMPDVLGNIVGYLSSSGSIVAAAEYSPYGRVMGTALAYQSFPIGYSGQYTDWESSLVYYGLRFYNPKHGRFINRDPAGEQGGYNLYAFCSNRPVRSWDTLGLADYDLNMAPKQYRGYIQRIIDTVKANQSNFCNDSFWIGADAKGRMLGLLINDAFAQSVYAGQQNAGLGSLSDWEAQNAAKYAAAGMPMEYGHIGDFEALEYQDPDSGEWLSWDTSIKPMNEGSGLDALLVASFATGGAGAIAGAIENTQNGVTGRWIGKNLKPYSTSWGGNGWTGGRIAFAGKMASAAKTVGNSFSVVGLGLSSVQGYNAFKQNDGYGMFQSGADMIVGGTGFFGPYGWAFSTGYFAGQFIDNWFGLSDKFARWYTGYP